MSKLKTHISQAYWCSLERNRIAKFNKAEFSFGEKDNARPISWFDELLEGGIRLIEKDESSSTANEKPMPLTFLITGPPGSGKTTFASELCYRLAKNEKKISLYISTETETYDVVKNARSFGFDKEKLYIKEYNKVKPEHPSVTVCGKEQFGGNKNVYQIVELAIKIVADRFVGSSGGQISNLLSKKIQFNKQTKKIEKFAPDILVIDSLNVIDKDNRGDFFHELLKVSSYGGSEILICILDDESIDRQHSSWSHICDVVLNLNYTNMKDYYLRTIEIVKARFQSHAWGRHQLKIYPGNSSILKEEAADLSDSKRIAYNRKLKRAHPYREEGGIFIYPSVHYYLSAYKRSVPDTKPERVDTRPRKLNDIIKFPRGRCSALFGCRGAHKSHLAFLHMLYRIHKKDECGLIISLRDDEQMTKETMEKILWREIFQKENNLKENEENLKKCSEKISQFINNEQLEILYFHPGYITPEEFFHRVYMSVQRIKSQGLPVTVVFNSLDQLSSRFPLCANQETFIPSLVTALSGEDITSIFIAVDEPGQPIELYGLLPLADLILSFYPHFIEFTDYYKHLNASWDFDGLGAKFKDKADSMHQKLEETKLNAIVIEVVRYAGGRRAGARGLLELIHKKDISTALYEEPGLHFTELSNLFSHGQPLGVYRFDRG